MTREFRHLPVMARQALELLNPRPGGKYLDGTVGGGGHARLLLEKSAPNGFLTGIDRDKEALAAAEAALQIFAGRFRLIHGTFGDICRGLHEKSERFDGFILDLGVSSHQLDTAERGFSFRLDGPLDMRMDRSGGPSAGELVNKLAEAELARIIREYGEERWAVRIAAAIVRERAKRDFTSTSALSETVTASVPRKFRENRIHPATRTFQALRIAVNNELSGLSDAIAGMFRLLVPGGRGVVISFHSLEDRIVKNLFRELAAGCECPRNFPLCVCNRTPAARIMTSRPVTPDETEQLENPRARSARMRAFEKT